MGSATADSTTQITWTWTRADNDCFGFDLTDNVGTDKAPVYPNAGWLSRIASAWAENGLVPNTQYTRKVHAWNGALDSVYSAVASRYTLSVAPTSGSVTPDNANPCANAPVTWSAVGGFGAGTVQYYRYGWDQTATHSWGDTEAQWSGGTLQTTPTTAGTWYLHVKGYNGDHVGNGTYDYAVTAKAGPAAPSAGNNGPLCAGSRLDLTASTVEGATYAWTGPNGFSSTAQNPSIVGVTTAASGIYSVAVTANGCTSIPGTTSVTVNPAAATTAISGAAEVAIGQLGQAYSVTATSGSSYSWTVPSGATITSGGSGPNNNQIMVSFGSAGGDITVTETTSGGCVGSPVSLAVAVGPNHAPEAQELRWARRAG